MADDSWQKVREIFDAALRRQPEERRRFLLETCGEDKTLLAEVESLLSSLVSAESFMERPAVAEVAVIIETEQNRLEAGKCFGHYEIVEQIGAGGMGEVYLAKDTRLERKTAIKILPGSVSQDEERMQRFVREAKSASALNHPNIITIYEIGKTGNTHFIATEYIEGHTLRKRLEGASINLKSALEIAIQVASALDAAHRTGIVHRDIKPENVMIRPDGLVKILDFGIAKLTERLSETDLEGATEAQTRAGMIIGTAAYMSPEQARGQTIDARSDVFSFGVMLYEMLAGKRPFEGENAMDVIGSILNKEPVPLSRQSPEVPHEIERIVNKTLRKDREERYQTVKDTLIDLRDVKQDLEFQKKLERTTGPDRKEAKTQVVNATTSDLASQTTSSAEYIFREIKQHKRGFLAAFSILLLSMIGSGYWLYSNRPLSTNTKQIQSIAVLPLANLSGDASQDYFAEGMTETLIAGLAKVGALRVISRTSVMQYKGAQKPLPEIARELNVDAIVEGSVRRFGERVHITVQLIYAPTDRHLWSETYDRDVRDILTLQNEVARAVTQEIQIKLTPQEQMRLARARTINPAAYDYFLRGRFHVSRETKADNQTAIEMFERAVAADPNFAAAYAELARACVSRFFFFTPDEKQWEEKAFVAVEKALSLDPDLAEARLARGLLLWTPSNHFPHDKVIQEYRRALALNPNLDEAQDQLAIVYGHVGLFDEALRELEKAVAINPSNALARFRIGQIFLYQGNNERALTTLRSIPREANPALVGCHTALALLHLGRSEEAAAMLEELLKKYPEDSGGLLTSVQALMAAVAGGEDAAERKIRNAIEKGKGFGHFHHTAYNIACAYSLMKKPEQAIKWLEAAAASGFLCYPLFESDPYLNSLREDSRFVTLMTRLKEQWKYYKAIS